MTSRITVKVPATGTDLVLHGDERTVPALSDGLAAKVSYYAEIDGTPGSPNFSVIDATGSKQVALLDGGDVAQGTTTDAAWSGSPGAATGISIWKYLGTKLEAIRALLAGTLTVVATGTATSAKQDTAQTTLAAILAGVTDTSPVSVSTSTGTSAASEFTRPGDTTVYTYGDVVGTNPATYLTFAAVTRLASSVGYIVGVQVATDNWLCRQALRLHLYNVAPTPIVDNAVFEMEYTDKASYLGFIDLPACQSGPSSASGGATAVLNENFRYCIVSDSSSRIFGMLESRDGSTPTSGEKFYVSLTLEKN